MSGVTNFIVRINGQKLPFNPRSIRYHHTSRDNAEYITTKSGVGGDAVRTVSIGGGSRSIKHTVSFIINQQPTTPLDGSMDATDYILMLRHAQDNQIPVRLEIIETALSTPRRGQNQITGTYIGTNPDGTLTGKNIYADGANSLPSFDRIIGRDFGDYIVSDISDVQEASSAFRKSASVTFEQYVPVIKRVGRLKTSSAASGLSVSFTEVSAETPSGTEPGMRLINAGETSLNVVYDSLTGQIAPTQNPANMYPPYAYSSMYYYGMYPIRGVERVSASTRQAADQRAPLVTETWDEWANKWMDRVNTFAGWINTGIAGAAAAVTTVMDTIEGTVMGAASYIAPFISTAGRVYLAATTGGWTELARTAFMNYPYSSLLISRVDDAYRRAVQSYTNTLEIIGGTARELVIPAWTQSPFGLGYDETVNASYYDKIPPGEAPMPESPSQV